MFLSLALPVRRQRVVKYLPSGCLNVQERKQIYPYSYRTHSAYAPPLYTHSTQSIPFRFAFFFFLPLKFHRPRDTHERAFTDTTAPRTFPLLIRNANRFILLLKKEESQSSRLWVRRDEPVTEWAPLKKCRSPRDPFLLCSHRRRCHPTRTISSC